MKRKMIKQKLVGLAILVIAALIVYLASKGVTVEDRDATPAVILIPFGLYLLLTNECCVL